jgi:hypothetical protein
VMNLTCKTIVGEVESSSSFILITTSLVSFWTNFTFKVHITLQMILLISGKNTIFLCCDLIQFDYCFVAKIHMMTLWQWWFSMMVISGALRSTTTRGTTWILYQMDRDQLSFKTYSVEKDLDGSLFGTIVDLY